MPMFARTPTVDAVAATSVAAPPPLWRTLTSSSPLLGLVITTVLIGNEARCVLLDACRGRVCGAD